MPDLVGIWWVDVLGVAAIVVGSLWTLWWKFFRPIVAAARALVELARMVHEVHDHVIPDDSDPYSHMKLHERVSAVGATAEFAAGEAHAARSEIAAHAKTDEDNFEAVAEWSAENFDSPIRLPARS